MLYSLFPSPYDTDIIDILHKCQGFFIGFLIFVILINLFNQFYEFCPYYIVPYRVIISGTYKITHGTELYQSCLDSSHTSRNNRIGPSALGAVGTCYPVTVLLIAFASGLGMGTSIYCSQHFGAKNYQTLRSGITTSLIAFLPFSCLLCILGLTLSPWIIRLLAVPAEAVSETSDYLFIYILGMLFVIWILLGVAGLALATLISQAIAAAATAYSLWRLYNYLGCGNGHIRFLLPA